MSSVRLFLVVLVSALAGAARAQNTVPTVAKPFAAQTLNAGTGGGSFDLREYFIVPGVTGQVVQFDTVSGRFNVEMLANAAPRHVANFLTYVAAGDYANTIFHRSAVLDAGGGVSIVQGGGYRSNGGTNVDPITKRAAVALEYNLPNARGTLAAARTNDVNSATSEWYFNTRDNSTILGPANGGGYSVFGRVIGSGMTIVDAIAALPRLNAGSSFTELPVRNFAGALGEANLVIVRSITTATIYPTGSGAAVLGFAATSSDPAVVTASVSGSNLTLTAGTPGAATVTVRATDTNGGSATATIDVTVPGAARSAPRIVQQPEAQVQLAADAVHTVALAVAATGTPAPAYQWRRDGTALAGETGALLVLSGAGAAQAGTYTCTVENAEGRVTSDAAVVGLRATANPGRLINLSILAPFAAGETMTMGTVLGGAGTAGGKALLARAGGPALAQLGISPADLLPDPQLTLLSGTTAVATNGDWGGTAELTTAFAAVGAFAFPAGSKDAALLRPSLAPGGYTVDVRDNGTGAGVAIAELYDSTPAAALTAATPRLVNVSVRKVIPADGSLTAGFVVGGETAKTVLVRAIGPGLEQFGVGDVMANPQLTLFRRSTPIGENDDWGGAAQLAAVASRVGAFALPNAASRDAVVLVTLPPGNYSAQVRGAGGGGAALVEVYEVP